MGRLPEESLSLLISVVEGGRSYREVASDLGVASSTVERRIKGLLRRLQQAGALCPIRVDWLDSLVAIRSEREIIMAAARAHAYFSASWTAFQADRGRDFSGIVDGVSV